MFNEMWELFWTQVIEKREYYKLDDKSIFHYVVLEYLGYRPNNKPTELEKRRIRNMERGTEDYQKLENLYKKRFKSYTGIEDYACVVNR